MLQRQGDHDFALIAHQPAVDFLAEVERRRFDGVRPVRPGQVLPRPPP